MYSQPKNVFLNLPCLIGQQLYDERLQNYMKQFPYYKIEEDPLSKLLLFRNELCNNQEVIDYNFIFNCSQNKSYIIEELIALILDNVINVAQESIGKLFPT